MGVMTFLQYTDEMRRAAFISDMARTSSRTSPTWSHVDTLTRGLSGDDMQRLWAAFVQLTGGYGDFDTLTDRLALGNLANIMRSRKGN